MPFRTFIASLVVACLIALSKPAEADPIVFTSEATFLAATSIDAVQTFDSFRPFSTFVGSSIALSGVKYTTGPCTGLCWGVGFGSPTVTEPNGLQSFAIRPDVLGFGDGRSSTALGFYFVGASGGSGLPFLGWTATVRELDGSITTFTIPPNPVAAVTVEYLGLLSTIGIVSVTVADAAGDAFGVNWSFDNVARGPVFGGATLPDSAPIPEPATLLLVSGGLAGLCYRRRALARRLAQSGRLTTAGVGAPLRG
jgi:PEP-CTERM motif